MKTEEQRLKHNAYIRDYKANNPSYKEYMKNYLKEYHVENKEKLVKRATEWTSEWV